MIHRFCISHEKPLLPESWYDDCISLGDFQTDSVFHVKQLDRFWHEARPIAYGAAGTAVLPIAIERFANDAKFIEISSHRKRILPSPEGKQTILYQRDLNLTDLGKETELSVFIPKVDVEFLLAQPLYFENSIIGHYSLCHHRRDLLDYMSLAIDLGVLDSNSASELLAAKHLIPGGVEFGIYPKSWLIQTLRKIELVSREFLCRYGNRVKKYDIYQVRAVQFLSERLGSFLLIRHLVEQYSNNIPADIFGYVTIVATAKSSYTEGLADRPRNSSSWNRRKHNRAS